MSRFLVQFLVVTFLFSMVSLASATTYYFEADNIEGYGKVTYSFPGSMPPEFEFTKNSGTVDHNLATFTPGDYYVKITLEAFQIQPNSQTPYTQIIDSLSLSSPSPIYVPAPTPTGTYGPLSWNIDTTTDTVKLKYDFDNPSDPTGLNNSGVNLMLYLMDPDNTNPNNDGVMDANIKWDKLRVELNPVPVPSALVLLGTGIFGVLGIRSRKRNK